MLVRAFLGNELTLTADFETETGEAVPSEAHLYVKHPEDDERIEVTGGTSVGGWTWKWIPDKAGTWAVAVEAPGTSPAVQEDSIMVFPRRVAV